MNKVQGKTIISLILILAQGIGKRENGNKKKLAENGSPPFGET